MKAICLLVCVALCREIAGTIFHQRRQPKEYYEQRGIKQATPYGSADQAAEQGASSSQSEIEPELKHYLRRALKDKIEKFAILKPVQKIKEVVRNPVHGHHLSLYGVANSTVSPAVTPTADLSSDVHQWNNFKDAAGHGQVMSKKDVMKIYQAALNAQKHITAEEKEMINASLNAALQQSQGYALNATEMLKRYQYPVEEHVVQTEDGYYLTLFRIPPRDVGKGKPAAVVFLMHDILGSADDFLIRGPKRSLAYLLADAGYDVYLGNARSSRYSRHVRLHRALPGYWQFSNDEVALRDLPAMINYALQNSNQTKMFYVGHGTGSSAFFALASVRSEYNDKIMIMIALSPIVYLQHARSPMLRMLTQHSPMSKRLNEALGDGEFRPSAELVRSLGGDLCDSEVGSEQLCSNAYIAFSGLNVKNLDIGDIPALLLHVPAGASVRQMQQLAQAYDSHEFRMFDYGADLNMAVYGQSSAPAYNLTNVIAPKGLYYSEHDWLAHPKDLQRLYSEMRSVFDIISVPRDYFTHMDFQFGAQAPELVYKRLLVTFQIAIENLS